jgi:hypothetical protein
MGWMSSIFRQRAQDWILHRLTPAQVKSPLSGGAQADQRIEAEKHYLMVRLLSMRVVNVRSGIRRFYGAVHSYAALPHPDGTGRAEFNVLVAPTQLRDVDADRIDRVVQVGQTLFGPVPYRGGALDLEIGLFSIRSADLTAPFLGLLETLSKTAGVSFVAQALPFAEPLKTGIDILTGSEDDTVLEIGFAAEQWQPATGVWVNIRAARPDIMVEELSVEGDDFRLLHRGQPVSKYPYMLIEVAADTKRPTFFEIPELRQTYADLRAALKKGKVDDAHDALAVFRRTALTSGDLLFEDAERLVARTSAEVDAVLSAPARTRGFSARPDEAPELPPLEAIRLYG